MRAKEEAHSSLVKTNSETFRLSNDGRFPVKVSLAFENQPQVRVVLRGTTNSVVMYENKLGLLVWSSRISRHQLSLKLSEQ